MKREKEPPEWDRQVMELAQLYLQLDRPQLAFSYFERAKQQIEWLVALEPENLIYQDALTTHEMALWHYWLITDRERPEFRESFEPLEAQADAGPYDQRRWNIVFAQMHLADIYARTGRTAESRRLFRSSGQIWKELCEKNPDNHNYIVNSAQWCELCPFEEVVQEME